MKVWQSCKHLLSICLAFAWHLLVPGVAYGLTLCRMQRRNATQGRGIGRANLGQDPLTPMDGHVTHFGQVWHGSGNRRVSRTPRGHQPRESRPGKHFLLANPNAKPTLRVVTHKRTPEGDPQGPRQSHKDITRDGHVSGRGPARLGCRATECATLQCELLEGPGQLNSA